MRVDEIVHDRPFSRMLSFKCNISQPARTSNVRSCWGEWWWCWWLEEEEGRGVAEMLLALLLVLALPLLLPPPPVPPVPPPPPACWPARTEIAKIADLKTFFLEFTSLIANEGPPSSMLYCSSDPSAVPRNKRCSNERWMITIWGSMFDCLFWNHFFAICANTLNLQRKLFNEFMSEKRVKHSHMAK